MVTTAALPAEIEGALTEFVEAARGAFGEGLVSAVLFGSAVEGRLRPVSDINLILLLNRFDREKVDLLRDSFRAARAAIRLDVMFLLTSELEPVMDAFAVKFADILVRRRVLFGPDPFAHLAMTPDALRRRTIQVLLNLILRMRERYALVSLREEQLAQVAADVAGPLRACSHTILILEGRPAESPREALAQLLQGDQTHEAAALLQALDAVRRGEMLPSGKVPELVFSLMETAESMHRRVSAGSGNVGGRYGQPL